MSLLALSFSATVCAEQPLIIDSTAYTPTIPAANNSAIDQKAKPKNEDDSLGSGPLSIGTSSSIEYYEDGLTEILAADGDRNGKIDQADYDHWKAHFGRSKWTADYNKNGVVDTADYAVWRKGLGQQVATTTKYSSGNFKSIAFNSGVTIEFLDENFYGNNKGRFSTISYPDGLKRVYHQYWGYTDSVRYQGYYDSSNRLISFDAFDQFGSIVPPYEFSTSTISITSPKPSSVNDSGVIVYTSSGPNNQAFKHINNNGVVVWQQFTTDNNQTQEIFSSLEGRITDNIWHDTFPRISDNGNIVWMVQTENNNVYLYDGLSVRNFTNKTDGNTKGAGYPDINASGQIVWLEWTESTRAREVFFFDGIKTIQITNDGIGKSRPRINDRGQIAWVAGNSVIGHHPYFYNGSEILKIPTHSQSGSSGNVELDNYGNVAFIVGDEIRLYKENQILILPRDPFRKETLIMSKGGYIVWTSVFNPNELQIVIGKPIWLKFISSPANNVAQALSASENNLEPSEHILTPLGWSAIGKSLFEKDEENPEASAQQKIKVNSTRSYKKQRR